MPQKYLKPLANFKTQRNNFYNKISVALKADLPINQIDHARLVRVIVVLKVGTQLDTKRLFACKRTI